MQNGSYVYHEMAPKTRRGTITDGEMHNGKMRYIFHVDPRFGDAATFPEVYFYDYELVECERPSDQEVAAINKLVQLGSWLWAPTMESRRMTATLLLLDFNRSILDWIGAAEALMTDVTGHRDRPGVGALNSTGITMNGIPTNHYQFQNPQTGKFEVVKVMPAGTPDEVVREFDSFFELQNWVNDQWNRQGYLS